MSRIIPNIVAAIVLFAAAGSALACGGYGQFEEPSEQLQKAAHVVLASHDAAERDAAIQTLRDAGPVGLEAMMRRGGWLLQAAMHNPDGSQLADAIDAVAGQKDATFSGLYWYTDLERAKAESRRTGRPILSLRLLGKLTDEYSCANSRFFRTVLYANPQVARYLKQNYVLHWQSERPVPVITIDFGDGRTVKRTITGNSAHYVLDADGRVIDAVPGLYTPADFLRIVQRAQPYAVASPASTAEQRTQMLARYHREVDDEIARRFGAALKNQGVDVPKQVLPDAADAAPRAVGKAMVEMPVLVAMDPAWADKLGRELTEDQWAAVGRTPTAPRSVLGIVRTAQRDDAKAPVLSAHSIALMRRQDAEAYAKDPKLLDRRVASFERVILIDTARNELMFRRVIHRWLASEPQRTMSVSELNERVYTELFLTPGADPNLGLIPQAVYTALPGDGCAPR